MARFAKNSCSTLYSWFSGARRVSLAVHARPDGDAIGSASALAEYLRRSFGTQVRILVPDPCPGTLAFLVDATEVLDASADMQAAREWLDGSDLLVSLDHGDFSRTDELEPYLREAQSSTTTRTLRFRTTAWRSAAWKSLRPASCCTAY